MVGYSGMYGEETAKMNTEKKPGSGPGRASLIMGGISLVLFLMFINIPLAIIAIVLAVVGITGYEKKAASYAGLVCAVLSIVMCIGSYVVMFGNDNLLKVYEDMYSRDGMQKYYQILEDNGVTVDPQLMEEL